MSLVLQGLYTKLLDYYRTSVQRITGGDQEILFLFGDFL